MRAWGHDAPLTELRDWGGWSEALIFLLVWTPNDKRFQTKGDQRVRAWRLDVLYIQS